jgi:hypothetical protein
MWAWCSFVVRFVVCVSCSYVRKLLSCSSMVSCQRARDRRYPYDNRIRGHIKGGLLRQPA